MGVEVSDQLIKRIDKSSPVQGHPNMIPRHRGFWNIQDCVGLLGPLGHALNRVSLSDIPAVAVRDPTITAQRTMNPSRLHRLPVRRARG